ncbi:MAG: hypothetical protein JSV88_33370 [Candidatus Aminicenantes bacterium]|nr:MAG: hypothetical protein JSV88_33370 [Candidatus Aminicenantes bacterium]
MGHSGVINKATEQKRNPIPDNQKVVISRLKNSVYFSIGTCFIMTMTEEECFRLLAIHEKKVLADRNFKTLRGAKIHFMKKFKNQAWREDVAAEWTFFYQPDLDWIEEMLSIAEKLSSTN